MIGFKTHSTKLYKSDIKLKLFLLLAVSFASLRLEAQYVALKSNLVYDAIAVPSLGAEVRIDSILTVGVSGTYCPFSFASGRK